MSRSCLGPAATVLVPVPFVAVALAETWGTTYSMPATIACFAGLSPWLPERVRMYPETVSASARIGPTDINV